MKVHIPLTTSQYVEFKLMAGIQIVECRSVQEPPMDPTVGKKQNLDDRISLASMAATGQPNVEVVPRCTSASHPVDLVHLSRKSLGDRFVENEFLRLFRSQSSVNLARLECSKTAQDCRFAANVVFGSARRLGAWKVAREAKLVSDRCGSSIDVSDLRVAVNEANQYIDMLLGSVDG